MNPSEELAAWLNANRNDSPSARITPHCSGVRVELRLGWKMVSFSCGNLADAIHDAMRHAPAGVVRVRNEQRLDQEKRVADKAEELAMAKRELTRLEKLCSSPGPSP